MKERNREGEAEQLPAEPREPVPAEVAEVKVGQIVMTIDRGRYVSAIEQERVPIFYPAIVTFIQIDDDGQRTGRVNLCTFDTSGNTVPQIDAMWSAELKPDCWTANVDAVDNVKRETAKRAMAEEPAKPDNTLPTPPPEKPARPDQGLPEKPAPGRPDQGLPEKPGRPDRPDRPDQGLPGRPDQERPKR
ncbi:MAG: hypothetical protein ABWY78_06370 [Microvirga sp.]